MSNNHPSHSEHPMPGKGLTPSEGQGFDTQRTPPPGSVSPETGGRSALNSLPLGTFLSGGRYRIEQRIAAGGMGAVYRALDTRFKRPCAVKEMLENFQSEADHDRAVVWFEREATLLLDLNHPCIPRVRDFFAENGRHYLVMDFIDGRTLAQVLEQDACVVGVGRASGIAEARIRAWTAQLCNVLSYLHRQDPPVIFRDLKPGNVMVTANDEIKLIDFGIARTFQSQQQATVIMTPGYAPIEQLLGQPEPRSDLFALGVTMHRMLTRHEVINNRPDAFTFPPVRMLRPDVSIAFEYVLQRALAKDVNQRWASASEMEQAVLALPALDENGSTVTVLAPAPVATPPAQATPVHYSTEPSQPTPTPALPIVPGSSSPLLSAPLRSGSGPIATGAAQPYLTDARRFLTERRYDLAYEAVTRAHSLEPENALVHQFFGQVFAHRTPVRADLALQAYNRSLQIRPDDAETHRLVGDAWYYLHGDYVRAIPAYQQAARLGPEHFETYELLGQCYEKTNNFAQSIEAYREALRHVPAQPEVIRLRLYFALGQLGLRTNQFALAEYSFVQVLILNAADHQARFLLSQVYEREGKLEDAWRECLYVVNGPLGKNPGIQQHYFHLKTLLGR